MIFLKKKKTVSFLVSGRGSNFKAVADEIRKKKIKANVGVVISNKIDAPALEIAKKYNLNNMAILHGDFSERIEHDRAIVAELKKHGTDLVILAGYMRILTPYFIEQYRNKIINIHPSLLPAFPGKNAQQQALDYGVKVSGCTCHFVDEGMDTGKIINQGVVAIEKNDNIETLSAKILKIEHEILIKSVKQIMG